MMAKRIRKRKTSFLYENSLSLTLLALLLLFLLGQYYTGWQQYNIKNAEEGRPAIAFGSYIFTGHFMQATFENWESEFLQMSMYILFTVFLRQKGSAESKKLRGKTEVDRQPRRHPNAPWPVHRGGFVLWLYSHSLSIAFALLFFMSFGLHLYGSYNEYAQEQQAKHLAAVPMAQYFTMSRFWFESFQNWQSEFLAVLSIVYLSIWLRQKGSPESKPVDAPYFETE